MYEKYSQDLLYMTYSNNAMCPYVKERAIQTWNPYSFPTFTKYTCLTHSFFRAFMFHSCKYPSENPTANWFVLEMYCRAVAPTPLGPFSWRQRCLPCRVLTSLSLGISAGDLVTTCRSENKNRKRWFKMEMKKLPLCGRKNYLGTPLLIYIYNWHL